MTRSVALPSLRRLDGSTDSRTCYRCGVNFPISFRFCPTDGLDLEYKEPPLEDLARDFVPENKGKTKIPLVVFSTLVGLGILVMVGLSLLSNKPQNPGELIIRTSPPGAMVYVDGSLVGTAPLRIAQISSGDHQVRAIMPGYLFTGKIVKVVPFRKQTVEWTLQPVVRTQEGRSLVELTSSPELRRRFSPSPL